MYEEKLQTSSGKKVYCKFSRSMLFFYLREVQHCQERERCISILSVLYNTVFNKMQAKKETATVNILKFELKNVIILR
jgi:hypothetical protein